MSTSIDFSDCLSCSRQECGHTFIQVGGQIFLHVMIYFGTSLVEILDLPLLVYYGDKFLLTMDGLETAMAMQGRSQDFNGGYKDYARNM